MGYSFLYGFKKGNDLRLNTLYLYGENEEDDNEILEGLYFKKISKEEFDLCKLSIDTNRIIDDEHYKIYKEIKSKIDSKYDDSYEDPWKTKEEMFKYVTYERFLSVVARYPKKFVNLEIPLFKYKTVNLWSDETENYIIYNIDKKIIEINFKGELYQIKNEKNSVFNFMKKIKMLS